jgi:hypothetical protein
MTGKKADFVVDQQALKHRSFEGGDYLGTCCMCNERFIGPKRALRCRLCAESLTAEHGCSNSIADSGSI